jgi:hypothetical protein
MTEHIQAGKFGHFQNSDIAQGARPFNSLDKIKQTDCDGCRNYENGRKFKAECLKLMDKVHRTKNESLLQNEISLPEQLIPIEEEKGSLFGKMKGSIHILGDIVAPIDEMQISRPNS